MTTREQFIVEARSWVGVPYIHQGRNRFGVDCIGLVIAVRHALGLPHYDVADYGRVPDGVRLRSECAKFMTPVAEAQPGDVYLMRITKYPQHLAIATERGLLHAWGPAGKVVETTMPTSWRSRVVQCFSVDGVA